MKSLSLLAFVITTTLAVIDENRIHELEKKLEGVTLLERKFQDLARQVMLTELAIGERARTEYDSGIKQIRNTADGTKPYMVASHTFNMVCSIHEHSNYDRTVGMGEFAATLNGVDFRTRHNDYKLRMPHRHSKNFNAMEDIPYPKVPPSVLQKRSIPEQIREMQNYFRAFVFQNHNFRDYRPYFKPVLCYLEGTWTTNTKTLNEPFESDRHHIDAESWFDLQEKIRYTSYTGGKHYLENFSYLPTTIINMVNGTPEYAQWNYRIACHPLKEDLPLGLLEPVDDMAARIGHRWNITRFAHTRAARFRLAADSRLRGGQFHWEDGYGKFQDRRYYLGLLDKLMMEIPGKDNYPGMLHDTTFGVETMDARGARGKNSTLLNTAYYHRYFKHLRKGAMGTFRVHRGFSDSNLFVAQTSNPKVAEMKTDYCRKENNTRICTREGIRYSYAIPLEIIYLNPLMSWNPYNLHFEHDRRHKNRVTAGGRNGGLTADKAYNGTTYDNFYFTPSEFYHGSNVDKDAADTDKGVVGVLDTHGNVRKVKSSGVRITLPDIPGVGKVRMRYPIMPIASEGHPLGKELEAVKDVLNHLETMGSYLHEKPSALSGGGNAQADAHFRTSVTNQNPPGHHYHELYIPHEDMLDLAKGLTVTVVTTTDNSHDHTLEISQDKNTHKYVILKCDDQDHCWDGHTNELTRID